MKGDSFFHEEEEFSINTLLFKICLLLIGWNTIKRQPKFSVFAQRLYYLMTKLPFSKIT